MRVAIPCPIGVYVAAGARFLIVGRDHRHAHGDADVVEARLHGVTGDQEGLSKA